MVRSSQELDGEQGTWLDIVRNWLGKQGTGRKINH